MANSSFCTSFFPNVINSISDQSTGSFSSVAIRESDFDVMERQRPIGWSFFSKRNVAYLLNKAKACKPNADFSDIVDYMIEVYETMGDESTKKQISLVDQMNASFVQRFVQKCDILRKNIHDYNVLLANPHRIAPKPSYERPDRTIQLGRHNNLI